jgi:hypothetical protein
LKEKQILVFFLCSKSFKPPKTPFRRMNYTDALIYLKEHNITKDDGTFYEFGDVRPFCQYMCIRFGLIVIFNIHATVRTYQKHPNAK